MTPIYDSNNCSVAYQLNWSVAIFGRVDFPPQADWIEPLKAATHSDGVRILEFAVPKPNVAQLFVSTGPKSSPSDIVRCIKGRWQYIIREQQPSAFRRNYFIGSVGDANSETLSNYVARQADKHPMADDRVTARLAALQFHDPAVVLHEEQVGSHGKFVSALQIVIEKTQGWNEIRDEVLAGSRSMIERASASKGWRLSRIGLLSNHIHILLGCGITESPESVSLALLNNLAYAQGMTPAFRFSYYAGTFGSYDRNAIRRSL
jgi:REP element-mobilizing transposase RayT